MEQQASRVGNNTALKIFVVDGAPEIRRRLVAMVGAVTGVEVVGEADSIRAGGETMLGHDVEVLLLGLRPLAGGELDGLARLKRMRPQLRAIVLSNSTSPQYLQAILAAGADFCLDKTCEFGRVPEILGDWLANASVESDAPANQNYSQSEGDRDVRL